ncbi:MAG TPA: hypothetical protein VNJ01_05205 [Bacteriovoracaceae bacterium]|nr:hypothetical protein [Bacteriovoracaceae bacterium]
MEIFKLFIIVPPGLEAQAQKEIELKCPVVCHPVKGGIELEADLSWIETAHLNLKIPTRILMRMGEFKVRDFPKLYAKMVAFPWNTYLSHPRPEWVIKCAKSRLGHTGRIEETVKSGLSEAMKKQPLSQDWEKKDYPPQTFYIRILDDTLTLSLDLTGEPLYKRGFQKIKGEAPLRENFAAAFISELFSGLNQEVILVDPMCGSGTLLTEALNFHRPLHLRPFAFETAPFYKGRLLKLTPLDLKPLPVSEAIGFDLDEELLAKVAAEIKELPVFFKFCDTVKTPLKFNSEFVMICNPPYGERLKIPGKRGYFLKDAWEKFLQVDRPLRFGWVLPKDMDDLFLKPPGYQLRVKLELRNGGLPVSFWVWQRS